MTSRSTSAEHRFGIDLTVPPGWERVETDAFPLAFLAPPVRGYRTNIAFSQESFDPPTPVGLATGIALLREHQAAEYDDFELLDERETDIEEHFVYVEHYRYRATDPPASLTQLLALVLVRPGLVIKVDGSCLTELADHFVPVLDEIVLTIRFV